MFNKRIIDFFIDMACAVNFDKKILILYFAFFFLSSIGSAKAIPLDGYAAMVNNRIIAVTEVLSAMRPVEEKLKQLYTGAELEKKMEEAYENALNALIERELIMDYFDNQKEMVLPDTAVNSRVDEIIRNKFKNDYAAFRRALDSEGLTFDEWKKQLRTSIVISLLHEREVGKKVVISPRQIREFYQTHIQDYQHPLQVKVRAIVIKKGSSKEDGEAKRKEAEAIYAKLIAGENFVELATRVSEGYKADAGGDWGWIEPSSRRAELARVIEKLAINEISQVIETDDAFYIVKVEDRREASTIPFEEVADEIKEKLQREMANQLYVSWIERLKKQALIQKY
jgi:peptidyl-prolyl cis-trans isomerase SurA